MASSPCTTRQQQMLTNQADYGAIYDQLTFVDPADCPGLEQLRSERLQALAAAGGFLACGGSKPHSHGLSPGCRLCVAGSWSCLFVNGRCNLHCFYCPGRQDETGQPNTNNLAFASPAAYVAYLEKFDFRGMSLSGGEPLLTPERSLAFLNAAKRRFGDQLHCWMYTNGSLLDANLLGRLQDSGLDEIRFDIGATDYSLAKVAMAIGRIPTVTVEIPAVPEELPRLRAQLHDMAAIGVDYLNLHQLRLTAYNFPRFAGRPYRYLHGDKITVLESELAALELLNYAAEQKLQLPINYCSFIYKNRYQKAAARGRGAAIIGERCETLSPAGYLRSCTLRGTAQALQAIARQLARQLAATAGETAAWELSAAADQLRFCAPLGRMIDFTGVTLTLGYVATAVREGLSYRHPFREVTLAGGKKIVVERIKAREFVLDADRARQFFVAADAGADHGFGAQLADLLPFEQRASALQSYF